MDWPNQHADLRIISIKIRARLAADEAAGVPSAMGTENTNFDATLICYIVLVIPTTDCLCWSCVIRFLKRCNKFWLLIWTISTSYMDLIFALGKKYGFQKIVDVLIISVIFITIISLNVSILLSRIKGNVCDLWPVAKTSKTIIFFR